MDSGTLRHISPDEIAKNPENPRLVFRGAEMDTLLLSIKKYGIQVPLTVYAEREGYVLIDGERRWRCALKLNLKRIPAYVRAKPSPLENLLLMFNIHALREQWDYFTIASKLPVLIDLYEAENKRQPNEAELSEVTGLSRGQIRRCRFLLNLPDKYKKLLLAQLELPKSRQELTEDFFIEMERSLRTVQNRVPDLVQDLNTARDVLIHKFRENTITNVIDFRKVSKIATSVRSLGVKESKARSALKLILTDNKIGIVEVFEEQFEVKYDQRTLVRHVDSILEYLETISESDELEAISRDVRSKLETLGELIQKVLEG